MTSGALLEQPTGVCGDLNKPGEADDGRAFSGTLQPIALQCVSLPVLIISLIFIQDML